MAIVRVLRGLPAAEAGMQGASTVGRGEISLGDIITRIEGQAIRNQDDYLSALEKFKVKNITYRDPTRGMTTWF